MYIDNRNIQINANNNIRQSDTKNNGVTANTSFSSVLSNQIEFSKHATERLINRDINLSHDQMMRVENGIKTAKEKGIKESLVVVDNISLVVSVKNNKVITAVNNKDKIFTNIDGAVFV